MLEANVIEFKIELAFILKFMPDEIKKELNDLNIIPILKGEKLYFILPYHIDID